MASPSKRSFGVKVQSKSSGEQIYETPRSKVLKRIDAIRKEVIGILNEIDREQQTYLPLEKK